MRKKILMLLLSLAALAGAQVLAPSRAEAVKCWTTCCSNSPNTCITCCVGRPCPDLACP
ncbi:MAG TPA: hypothetical protein VE685_23045 [Thermoanaerobaculia bacterium]|nr:hypothetical protein [Thermoanaerobaculia bacterium]